MTGQISPVKKVLKWTIYYLDGSTFSSQDGIWEDAPPENVCSVKLIFDGQYNIWVKGVLETENYVRVFTGVKYLWKLGDQEDPNSFHSGEEAPPLKSNLIKKAYIINEDYLDSKSKLDEIMQATTLEMNQKIELEPEKTKDVNTSKYDILSTKYLDIPEDDKVKILDFYNKNNLAQDVCNFSLQSRKLND